VRQISGGEKPIVHKTVPSPLSIDHQGVAMNKLLAAIIVSTFALGSSVVFAASTMKLEDLTKEQRTEMRNRADKLVAERAATGNQTQATTKKMQKVKNPDAKQTKSGSRS
jgi:hypothetical protein